MAVVFKKKQYDERVLWLQLSKRSIMTRESFGCSFQKEAMTKESFGGSFQKEAF